MVEIKKTISITPVPKPRMTRSDKWKKRPCVVRYREYCDKLREAVGEIPEDILGGVILGFYIPMPRSWSQKSREEMSGAPHRKRPDVDNLTKAVFDALFKEDSHIWLSNSMKFWEDEYGPRIELTIT